MRSAIRSGAATLTLVTVLATLVAPGTATPAIARTTPGAAVPLTNLAHLDWLRDSVRPPAQPGHTTYHLSGEPAVGTACESAMCI